jgi:pimeloyl-ACP methyl ester carboxylesterase
MTTHLAVFLHSTGTGPFLWDHVPAEVIGRGKKLAPANLGYAPHAPLPRGQHISLRDEVAHLVALLPTGPDDPEGDLPLELYAHSYGATVAIAIARLLRPRIRSLFLFEPVLFGALARDPQPDADPGALAEAAHFASNPSFLDDEDQGGGDAWLAHFIDYWNRPGSWDRMPAPMQAYNRAAGWKMFQEVRACFYDNDRFADFTLDPYPNVTLALGERTTAASREMTRTLARLSPRARVVELPRTGHMAPLTHPALVGEAMLAHAQRL